MKPSAASPRARPSHLPQIVAACVAVAALALHFALVSPWRHDDAFISYRYAENLAAGRGPVYNPGERVEGYTSFLWVTLLAIGHRLGCDTVVLSQGLGFAAAAATLLLLAGAHRWIRSIDPPTAATAAVLAASCGVFTAWPASGMETTLYACLLLAFVLEHLLRFDGASLGAGKTASFGAAALHGALGALLVMTRPDGFLLVGVAWLDLVRHDARRRPGAALVSGAAAGMAVGFLALCLPYVAWRHAYYGYWFPNTFYAKVGLTAAALHRGLAYTARFLVPAAPLVAPIVAALAVARGRAALAPFAAVGVYLALHVAYIVAVGGDFTGAFRFYAPIVPLLALLAAVAVRALVAGRTALVLTAAAIAYGPIATRLVPELTPYLRNEKVAEQGEEVGRWLAQHAPSDALLATNTAGSVPYYSRLRTIDMLGLNDVHIAHRAMPGMGAHRAGHEKYDGRYVLERRPHYIQFGSSRGSVEPKYGSDREIAADPEFQLDYQLDVHRMSGKRFTYSFCIYRRRDVVER